MKMYLRNNNFEAKSKHNFSTVFSFFLYTNIFNYNIAIYCFTAVVKTVNFNLVKNLQGTDFR